MRAFYTGNCNFTADLCLMTNGHSTRLTVRSPEGTVLHISYHPTWNDAIETLRQCGEGWVNDLTGIAL